MEELGKLARLGLKHVAAIERGQKTASFDAIDRLAMALRIRPYELFLPYDHDGDSRVNQSFKQLVRELEQHASTPLKQTLITLLPLLEQLEGDAKTRKRTFDPNAPIRAEVSHTHWNIRVPNYLRKRLKTRG